MKTDVGIWVMLLLWSGRTDVALTLACGRCRCRWYTDVEGSDDGDGRR